MPVPYAKNLFLARPRSHELRRDPRQRRQFAQQLQLAAERRRYPLHVQELPYLGRDVADAAPSQRQRHAPAGTERVDQNRHRGAFDVFEKQGLSPVRPLRDAVGDLGNLEVPAHRLFHADELPFALEHADKIADVFNHLEFSAS